MKEIETIRAALEKWHKAKTMQEACEADDEYGDATDQDVMTDVLAHVDSQQAEIDRLKADAARYQWLRKTTNYATSNGEKVDVRNSPELWDASIDSMIAETPKEQP